jgi:hypothetical protein
VGNAKNRVAALVESELVLLAVTELLCERVESLLDVAINRIFMESLPIGAAEAQRGIIVLAEPELAKRLIPPNCREAHDSSAGNVFGLEYFGLCRLLEQSSR